MRARIIAIDGPAASGKSTVGKLLADRLGYLFFDSGVMYRAVTWAAMNLGIDVNNEEAVASLAESLEIDVRAASVNDGRGSDVWLDGQDVTWEIRSPEVDANVSVVSSYRGVRTALTNAQRRIGLRGNVVMVGRDIGTVVLPEADLKIYLDASVEERALRRTAELRERGEPADLAQILKSMRARDKFDSTRQLSPLRPAPDAVTVNSDKMSAEQVLELIQKMVGC